MERKGVSGVIVAILSILFLVVGLLVGYIITSNSIKCEDVKEENKDVVEKDEVKNEVDEAALLNEITKVYLDTYSYINSGEIAIDSDISKLEGTKKYFTNKALDYISRKNGPSNMVFFAGIFGLTDQGKRPLTIVSYTEDIVIATGQLVKGSEDVMYDADNYPLYIVFKKENNSWKIDLFE